MFDGISFFDDHNIQYSERGKNISSSDDWVGLNCPFCNDDGTHLGFSSHTGHFTCWKCGWHSQAETIKKLTGYSWHKVKQILEQYGGSERRRYKRFDRMKEIEVKMPPGTLPSLTGKHKRYLRNRNFDYKKLIETWGIEATGILGNYKNRIIAPIYYNGVLISYLGRDITGHHSERYKACNKDNERLPHKCSLYGMDLSIADTVLVVEGITDVWRMGIGCVGTMGSKVTRSQILLLNQRYTRQFFLFDPDEEAQDRANQAVMDLAVMGSQAENISLDINRDPGDMTDKEASYVLRDLLIR